MMEGMNESGFTQFVAAIWSEQDWQTQVREQSGKTLVLVQRQGSTVERGIVWAHHSTDQIGGEEVSAFTELCRENGAKKSAVVSRGTFTDEAAQAARKAGINLLDDEKLETIVESQGLADLVSEYGGSDDEAGLLGKLPDLDIDGVDQLGAVRESVGDRIEIGRASCRERVCQYV